jgi:predicted transcriptional regulator
LAALALSVSIYHDARWAGVLQATRAGATVDEIAMALGISIDDACDLVQRVRARDLERKAGR